MVEDADFFDSDVHNNNRLLGAADGQDSFFGPVPSGGSPGLAGEGAVN